MQARARNHTLRLFLVAAVLLGAAALPAGAQEDFQSSTSNVGYIDNAIPGNIFRLRMEAAYDINRSDRAEYLYLRGADPRIDYQDLAQYVEVAWAPQLSTFVELHEHMVNPTLAPNASGLGDMNLGFKWAFLYQENTVGTFQLRTYIPTGNPLQVLGNGHASLEPGFLLLERLSERWYFEGEFKDWIPLTENGFAGNILNYGAGFSYLAYNSPRVRIAPVVEMVGWTVLGGKETVVSPSGIPPAVVPADNTGGFPVQSAAGDTIINAKVGVRMRWGPWGDFYAGYGRALTGEFWYKNMFRLEYRLTF